MKAIRRAIYFVAALAFAFSVSVKGEIQHMRSAMPEFKIPAYTGQRYEDRVPDTLDLAERARLAIRGLTSVTDPTVDYDIFFVSILYRNPPVLVHQYSDICAVKFYEAVPLLRLMSGDEKNSAVDEAWMRAELGSIGPDGLSYLTLQGRPWLQGEDMYAWCPNACWPDGTITSPKGKEFSALSDSVVMGRILAPFMIYYQRDKNQMWVEHARRMVDRIQELVIDKGDYAYLPARIFVPGAKVPDDAPAPVGLMAEELGGRQIQGLAQYYRVTHYEPARKLSGKLANYLRSHAGFYDEQGRFTDPAPANSLTTATVQPTGPGKNDAAMGQNLIVGGHFHGHAIGLLAMLEYASVAQDRELVDFIKRSFEWARDHAYGSSLTGWFPEAVAPNYADSETCCVADMVALALRLSEAGVGDYRDDADRWIRNALAESQFTRTDWMDSAGKDLPIQAVANNQSTERVAERHLGLFTGYQTGNDYGITDGAPTGYAACCAGNGSRTLYYVWEDIIRKQNSSLRLNLLLNRASPWADVHSHLPYTGRVDLKIKQPFEHVWLRVPQWVASGSAELKCKKNDKPVDVSWEGRYVDAGAVKAGDKISMEFPISERTVKEKVGDTEYTYIIKGNDVVNVEPKGKFCPLYQRDKYRENKTKWVKRQRFVSSLEIPW